MNVGCLREPTASAQLWLLLSLLFLQYSMTSPTDKALTLVCGDGERVTVDSLASIGRSQLVQSLPCVPEEISVPFSKREVASWNAFNGAESSSKSFIYCIAALKVPILFASVVVPTGEARVLVVSDTGRCVVLRGASAIRTRHAVRCSW